jgi:hypothetical protein
VRATAGHLGRIVALLFGEEPRQQVREDLRRFKQLMEAGEIATSTDPAQHASGGPSAAPRAGRRSRCTHEGHVDGHRNIEVEQVPDPTIMNASDAIVKITSTAICGSDRTSTASHHETAM